MFHGSIPALITPFDENDALDARAFAAFIDWQIAEGSDAVAPVGTTGESPTLTHEEHRAVVSLAVRAARGRVPVIAGAGSNSTAEACALAAHAREAGADGVLVVTPYYNKPTQQGLIRHYSAVAQAAGGLPVIIYNIPSRSVIDMSVDTMAELARIPGISGVKDATANLARPLHTRAACGPAFCQLSGEDHTALAFLAAGGHGCISVTANVAPRLCADLQRAWREGRIADAQAIQERLLPLHDALFCETSPGPVKYAASLLGHARAATRLPLVPLAEVSRARVEHALQTLGLR